MPGIIQRINPTAPCWWFCCVENDQKWPCHPSMDWFKGTSTGNQCFYHEDPMNPKWVVSRTFDVEPILRMSWWIQRRLTATSPEWWLVKGLIPIWPHIRLMNYCACRNLCCTCILPSIEICSRAGGLMVVYELWDLVVTTWLALLSLLSLKKYKTGINPHTALLRRSSIFPMFRLDRVIGGCI